MALITIITAVVKRRNGAIFTIIPISSAAMMIPATVMLLPRSSSPTDVRSHPIVQFSSLQGITTVVRVRGFLK